MCFIVCTSALKAESKLLNVNSIDIDKASLGKEMPYPVEKIYIHFDRSSYFLGDELWFKVYLMDGSTNTPSAESKVVYVELIDPSNQIVKSRTIQTENGGGEGEFELGVDMNSGLYTVRAYTNYMRNFDNSFFFSKDIYINSFNGLKRTSMDSGLNENIETDSLDNVEEPRPDIQFFPEGGSMVTGLPARLGFKAIDYTGKGINVSGVLMDDANKELIGFNTLHLGMGSVMIIPKNSNGLKAKVKYKGNEFIYELPPVMENGVIMRVVNRGDSYQINLQSSLKQGVNGISLIGEQRGKVVCQATLNGSQPQGTVRVPFSTLQDGVIKFTLYDKKKQPLCERLVFAETNDDNPEVAVKPNKSKFGNRALVELEISLKNASKLPANVSIAVTDMGTNTKSGCGFDILTYLLLNSEVKGAIEDPCYYFNSTGPERKRVLDLLLITQGWRNYLWNQVEASSAKELLYSYESGIDFKGSVRSIFNNEILVHSDVALTYTNKKIFGHDQSKTFGEGRFLFPGYLFKDSTSIIIEARKKQAKNKGNAGVSTDFYIVLDSFSSPEITSRPSRNIFKNDELFQISETAQESDYLDQLYANQPNFEQLENVEVKVSGRRPVNPYHRDNMRYSQPQHRVDYTKENVVALGNDLLWTFLNRTPGISRVAGRGAAGASTVAGAYYYRGSRIVFFLDGVRYSGAASIETLVNANDVSFIDLLSGPQAVSYSCEAAIIVYTKTSDGRKGYGNGWSKKGVVNFIYPGIYVAKEFYKPLYDAGKDEQMESDYRVTLHWEPTLRLDPNGKTKISFFTADPEAKYRVELEGITLDGFPVREEAFFNVEN